MLLFSLGHVFVPSLVELLELCDVSLFHLIALLLLTHEQLTLLVIEILQLQLYYSILGHLSLNVLALPFTSFPVLVQHFNKIFKVVFFLLLLLLFFHNFKFDIYYLWNAITHLT